MPDDTEITIDSKDDKEGWAEIKAWYQAHPDVKERPALQFPVDIKWKDGTVTTINNKEEMMEARKKCGDDKFDRKRCFRLVLPVTFDMPDGSTITIEEREDWKLIRQWYKDHPDYDKKPELQFPVDIKYKDGIVVTINNKEEMKEARENCDGDGGKKRCFWLVYPVTYILPDGTTVDIDSKDDKDGWMEIKDWYKEHPDVIERPSLQYPVDIKHKDGTVVTINNKEEMIDAKKDCQDEDKG
jgi:invasion protein IalB